MALYLTRTPGRIPSKRGEKKSPHPLPPLMTRTSSGAKKSGPPTHPNRFAFTHNRNSRLTKIILALPINGLCTDCREVIEWRKRFRKYKPLTVPKRCVRCGERAVKDAYHVICKSCAVASRACAKCLQSYVEVKEVPGTALSTAEDERLGDDPAGTGSDGGDQDTTWGIPSASNEAEDHNDRDQDDDDDCPSDDNVGH